MRKASTRRAKQNREYTKVRLEYLNEHPYCERCEGNQATEIHPKKGRIELLLINKEFFCALCHNCHVWVENNPVEAKEQGFSLNRL